MTRHQRVNILNLDKFTALHNASKLFSESFVPLPFFSVLLWRGTSEPGWKQANLGAQNCMSSVASIFTDTDGTVTLTTLPSASPILPCSRLMVFIPCRRRVASGHFADKHVLIETVIKKATSASPCGSHTLCNCSHRVGGTCVRAFSCLKTTMSQTRSGVMVHRGRAHSMPADCCSERCNQWSSGETEHRTACNRCDPCWDSRAKSLTGPQEERGLHACRAGEAAAARTRRKVSERKTEITAQCPTSHRQLIDVSIRSAFAESGPERQGP